MGFKPRLVEIDVARANSIPYQLKFVVLDSSKTFDDPRSQSGSLQLQRRLTLDFNLPRVEREGGELFAIHQRELGRGKVGHILRGGAGYPLRRKCGNHCLVHVAAVLYGPSAQCITWAVIDC